MRIETVGSEGIEWRVKIPRGKMGRYREVFASANDEGTIQAWDARELFSRPENHTTMSLRRALEIAGFEMEEV